MRRIAVSLVWSSLFVLAMIVAPAAVRSAGGVFPHAPHDAAHGVGCIDCHRYPLNGGWPGFPPSDPTADDTLANFICLRCHGDGGTAPVAALHSSLGMGSMSRIAGWTTQCVECHDPHFQEQLHWYTAQGDALFLVRGRIVGVQVDYSSPDAPRSLLTLENVATVGGWQDPARWSAKSGPGRGLVLVAPADAPRYTFEVEAASGGTVTVLGEVDASLAGRAVGLLYGQLINYEVRHGDGGRVVRFFSPENGGLVDQSGDPPVGLCQVCHTQTIHWSPAAPPGDDHHAADDCTACHTHDRGFGHGGDGSGPACAACHDSGKHVAHLQTFACSACHDIDRMRNQDGTIALDLDTTTVCLTCHTDTSPSLAELKAGWYDPNFTLGCLSCHAVLQDNGDGIPAAGRRAVAGEFPPNNGHAHYGAQLDDAACLVCHDQTTHTDGYVDLLDPDGGPGFRFVTPADLAGDPDLSDFCMACHDSDGATRLALPFDPFGNGNRPPDVRTLFSGTLQWYEWYGDFCFGYEGTKRPGNSHHDVSDADQAFSGAKIECLDCHGVHTAAAGQPVVDPFATTTPWQGSVNAFCLQCHAGGTPNDPGWPTGVWGPGYYRSHPPGEPCDSDGDGVVDSGYVWDCGDRCIVEADARSVIGDSSCNDGYSNFDLRCDAFQNDGGDCGPEPLLDGYSLLNGIDSCGFYSQAPWHNDITWTHSAHGGDSKRGWAGYVQNPPAPAYELDCIACHDPHGSATAANPAGNPYMIRDYVDGTVFIDDGSRPGNHYQQPGTAGEVVIPVTADGPVMAALCEKCHADWQNAYDWHSFCTACISCHAHGGAFGGNDWGDAPNDVQWCP